MNEILCPECRHDIDDAYLSFDEEGHEDWKCSGGDCDCDLSPSGIARALLRATEPESRVTWRKGESKAEIRRAWQLGRRAQVVAIWGGITVTRDGEINDEDGFGLYSVEGWLEGDRISSITVWLPESKHI